MQRLLVLAALALVAVASVAQAQYQITSGCNPAGGGGSMSGNQPPPLGPWYNYWPLEAHFQMPAMPEYPYWGPPQTLPPPQNGGYGQFGGPKGGGMPAMQTPPPAQTGAAQPQMPVQQQPRAMYYQNPYAPYQGMGYNYPAWGYPQQTQPAARPQQTQPTARPQATPTSGGGVNR